jgi:hypothetical protein
MATMLPPALLLLLLLTTCSNAYHLPGQVEHSLENRAASQGGWAIYTQGSCPLNYSLACGDKNVLNQICCPANNKCFKYPLWEYYCCPGSKHQTLSNYSLFGIDLLMQL